MATEKTKVFIEGVKQKTFAGGEKRQVFAELFAFLFLETFDDWVPVTRLDAGAPIVNGAEDFDAWVPVTVLDAGPPITNGTETFDAWI